MTSESSLLRLLPSVDLILRRPALQKLMGRYSHRIVVSGIQICLDELREEIRTGRLEENRLAERLETLEKTLEERLRARFTPSLRPVVNATGIILHTNVGRAPISIAIAEAAARIAVTYSNLEYDLEEGRRGHRDSHFEARMVRLLGCEGATVCNNSAAAVFLILNTLARGRQVIVSRGELIEIGGSFRLPAIMEASGAILREVGTTNRTRLSDYREAISSDTALILRVHPSNYRIVGFAERPSILELVGLAGEAGIPLVEDAGAGYLLETDLDFLRDEPPVIRLLREGTGLVCFSGDKLLGGPQAGVIVGRKALVNRIRKNPLMRTCRVDKSTYAALEATLIEYEKGTWTESLPIYRMLSLSPEAIGQRAASLAVRLEQGRFRTRLKDGESLTGGGAAPEQPIPTVLLAVSSLFHSASECEAFLRDNDPPILCRIEEDELILDLRTVFPEQEDLIASAFGALAARR